VHSYSLAKGRFRKNFFDVSLGERLGKPTIYSGIDKCLMMAL
jgi:hypothetical protein